MAAWARAASSTSRSGSSRPRCCRAASARAVGRLDSLTTALNSVTRKVDRGDGSLGKLVNEDKLYQDLSASVASLRALIDDIKKNPKDYFRFSIF